MTHLFVRYGDEICLTDLGVGGVVAGDGEVTKTVFVDKETIFIPNSTIHNQPLCLFCVRPKFQYAASKSFRKKLQRSVVKIDAHNWSTKLETSDPLYQELAREKKQTEDERETNSMEARRASGRHVAYGSVIQLMHSCSGRYVTQTKNRAPHDRLSMEVVLTADGDEGSWWRVMPAEKVRSAGEWVRQKDKVLLVSVKFQDSFLHAASERTPILISDSDALNDQQGELGSRVLRQTSFSSVTCPLDEMVGRILLPASSCARFEVNASPSSTSSFQLSVFKPADTSRGASQPAQKFIEGSCVCTLYRRESNCFLVGDALDGTVQWLPSDPSNQLRALWRVKRRELELGGTPLLRQQPSLEIQHLASGLYLTPPAAETNTAVSRQASGAASIHAEEVHLDVKAPARQWLVRAYTEAVEAVEQETGLVDREVVWVELEDRTNSSAASHICLSSARTRPSGEVLDDDEGRPAVLALTDELDNSEVIEVACVDLDLADEVAFIGRCRPVLVGLRDQMELLPAVSEHEVSAISAHGEQAEAQSRVDALVKHVMPVAECCLVAMINACSKSSELDPMLREGPPVKHSQDRLWGTGMTRLVMEILSLGMGKFPTSSPSMQNATRQYELILSMRARHPHLWGLSMLCCRLLLRCCIDHDGNRQIVAPYNKQLQRPELMDLGIFELLQESLATSLDTVLAVDLSRMSYAIEAMLQIPTGAMRALRILAGICENNGIPILRNQNLCLSFLEACQHLVPSVRVSETDVELTDAGSSEAVSIKALRRRCGDVQHADIASAVPVGTDSQDTVVAYYLGLLDCICLVSKGRNSRAHNFFKQNAERFGVGFAHLLKAITDEDLLSSYRLRCCKLIEVLYIDTDPHTEIPGRSFTHLWPRVIPALSGDDQFMKSFSYLGSNALSDLKDTLTALLKRHGRMNVEAVEKNRFLKGVMVLVRALLRFGFFHRRDASSFDVVADTEAIRGIVAPILQVLDGRDDFCAAVGGMSGHLARFEPADKCLVVMELRLNCLRLLRDLFMCAYGVRQKQFIALWDKMLETRMGISNWASACAAMRTTKSAPSVARETSVTATTISAISGLAKVAPEPAVSLREYLDGVKSWKSSPPWTRGDLDELKRQILSAHLMFSDLFPQVIEIGSGGQTEVPHFFKVIMDIILYKHAALKEQAIHTLFRLFNQTVSVLDILGNTQIVCDPLTAELFVRLRSESVTMRSSIGLLQSTDGDYLEQVRSVQVASVLTSSIQSRGQGDEAKDKLRRDQAFTTCFDILEGWTELCTDTPHGDVDRKSVRRMLFNFGASHIALAILQIPCETTQPNGPGTMKHLADVRMRELFASVSDFLSQLVVGMPELQDDLLEAGKVLSNHAHIEGLRMHRALAATFKDNEKALADRGPSFLRFYLKDMMKLYHRPRVSWMQLVTELCTTRENQQCCFKYLSSNHTKTKHVLGQLTDWDRMLELMAVAGTSPPDLDTNELLVAAALLDVLSACCSGKSPAAEVHSASLLSWIDGIRMLVGTNLGSSGARLHIPARIEFHVKGSMMRFLHKVYIETGVKRLVEEASRPANGLFSLPSDDLRFKGCEPLVLSLIHDVKSLAQDVVRITDASPDNDLRARFNYVFGVVFPMLADLFHHPPSTASLGDGGASACEALFDSICELRDLELPWELRSVEIMGRSCDAKKQAWSALHRMSVQGRVRPEWVRQPRNQTYVKAEDKTDVSELRLVEQALQRSCAEFLNRLILDAGGAGAPQAAPRGLAHLALFLNQSCEAPLYDADKFEELGLAPPANPRFHDIMMAILEITKESSTSEETLVQVLQLVRCCLYVCEPNILDEPHKMTAKELEGKWFDFLQLNAIKKNSEPADENLKWLQERFDAIGATVAALRLASHHSAVVRREAILLLLGLLQGGNRKVQKTTAVYLAQARGKALFKAITNILDEGTESLKDFKRTIKLVKRAVNKDANSQRTFCLTSREDRGDLNLNPTVSLQLLTLTLRLLQLFCEGQYKPLQRLMHRQPGLPNYDLLERCLDIFEVVHPLLVDAMALNDGELVVFTLQLLETISEMCQGPNRTNQDVVLSSNFLAGCNRVLSSVVYTPLEESNCKAFNMECSTNDLRSWLKSDVVSCILALLESCNDGKVPHRMMEFVELRNVTSQMLSVGRILGLCELQDPETVQQQDDDDAMGSFAVSGSILHHIGSSFRRGSGIPARSSGRDSRRSHTHYTPLLLQLRQMAIARNAARLQLVSSMHFSLEYEKTLDKELSSLYFLLQILQEFEATGQVHDEMSRLRAEQPVLMGRLGAETFEVELVRRRGRSQARVAERVYFRLSGELLNVMTNSHFQKRIFHDLFDVPRGNPVEKAKVILAKLKGSINRISWLVWAAQSNRFRRFVINHRETFESLPLYVSFLITILVMACYGVPLDPNTGRALGEGKFWGYNLNAPGYHDFDEPYPFANETSDPTGLGATYSGVVWATDPALKFRLRLVSRWDSTGEWDFWSPARPIAVALTVLHLFCSIINFFAHVSHEFPLAVRASLEEHRRSQTDDRRPPDDTSDIAAPGQYGRRVLQSMRPPPVPDKYSVGIGFWLLLIRRAPLFLYFALQVMLSVLGFLRSPFFHVMYMLDIFRQPAGRLVTQSLVHGGPNLVRSFVLGIVVLVCFGFFSYEYFSEIVNAEQQVCRTPYQCVEKHVMDSLTGDLTTVLGNDLGVFTFPSMVLWADSWQAFRGCFVMVSLIFWVFLLQGIIQGQIIDAFAEMRNNAEALAADLEQKCFVSSVDRFEFNAYPGEWEKRRGGKYVFNYLFFFLMLLRKDPEELNGLENTVLQQFEEDEVDFFPIETFVARERQRRGESATEDLYDMVRSLTSDMQRVERDLSSGMKEMREAVDKILSRLDERSDAAVPESPARSLRTGLTSAILASQAPSD